MTLVVLTIGIVLLVSALRGTYGALFADLRQDVPKFTVWAAALIALGAIGYIPGIKPISRGLMTLVLVVIIMSNYSSILKGFEAVAKPPASKQTAPTPANSNSRATVPDYAQLDEMPTPSAFSSAAIGH